MIPIFSPFVGEGVDGRTLLYERLNDQLASENKRLYELLSQERERYDELKDLFDNHLGLVAKAEESEEEGLEPIRGYYPSSKRARNLQVLSAKKFVKDDNGE